MKRLVALLAILSVVLAGLAVWQPTPAVAQDQNCFVEFGDSTFTSAGTLHSVRAVQGANVVSNIVTVAAGSDPNGEIRGKLIINNGVSGNISVQRSQDNFVTSVPVTPIPATVNCTDGNREYDGCTRLGVDIVAGFGTGSPTPTMQLAIFKDGNPVFVKNCSGTNTLINIQEQLPDPVYIVAASRGAVRAWQSRVAKATATRTEVISCNHIGQLLSICISATHYVQVCTSCLLYKG